MKIISRSCCASRVFGSVFVCWMSIVANLAVADSNALQKSEEGIIAQAQAMMHQYESLSGSFEQLKTLADVPFPVKSRGTFQIENANYLLWQVASPIKSRLEMDLTKGRLLVDDKNYAGQAGDNPAMDVVGEIIVAVFAGNWSALQEYFTVHGKAVDHQAAAEKTSGWSLVLKPKSDALSQAIQQIDLSGGEYIRTVNIVERNQDVTHIRFYDVNESAISSSTENNSR